MPVFSSSNSSIFAFFSAVNALTQLSVSKPVTNPLNEIALITVLSLISPHFSFVRSSVLELSVQNYFYNLLIPLFTYL